MKLKIILVGFLMCVQFALANDIYVRTFDELMQSADDSISGDTIIILDNLASTENIGNGFYTKEITFEGDNYFIDGGNVFGGFVLSNGSLFENLQIINCKGQLSGNSYFAGAILNALSDTVIKNVVFNDNHADSQSFNFALGGAVYNYRDGKLSIDSSLFYNNYTDAASSSGGALGSESDTTGTTEVDINNSIFSNNYSKGSVTSYGGAVYNGRNSTLNIASSLFDSNRAIGDERDTYTYGGSIFNIGRMDIKNTYFNNNHVLGSNGSFSYGGAIYNNSDLNIENSVFNNNYINSDIDASGGAIYNYINGKLTIKNSAFLNNYLESSSSRGGAIGNEGEVIIENSTFQGNKDQSGANDIFSNNIIRFKGEGTTNIFDGIRGSGLIYKEDSGILNLGGNNANYRGDFLFQGGRVNILKGCNYFNSENTSFSSGVIFDMQNSEINNINFGSMNLSQESYIYPDVNFNTNTMDTISADSLSGQGNIYIPDLLISGTPEGNFISIPFSNSVLKDSIRYSPKIIKTPIFDYFSSYNSQDGNFNFSKKGFNSGILSSLVSSQLAGYLMQIDTFNRVFSNLDMVMVMDEYDKVGVSFQNKVASISKNRFEFSNLSIPEQREGIWFKPYSVFENVPLKNGIDVSNIGWGSLFGSQSGLKDLKKGWKGMFGAYAMYNGSYQTFDNNDIYNNGGLFGLTAAFYKNKFYSLWSINAGANCAKAHTYFGSEDFTTLNAAVAQKTGYNLSLFKNRLIIQPNLMMAYSFINTFDYSAPFSVDINTEPLNAIHIEPQLKIIANLKDFLQPYLSVSVAWNVLDAGRFKANDVYLPDLSVKPYVRYGVGIQKRWGDRILGFFEAMVRNGGREGIGLMLGLRISI